MTIPSDDSVAELLQRLRSDGLTDYEIAPLLRKALDELNWSHEGDDWW